jgi:hypothetical protein
MVLKKDNKESSHFFNGGKYYLGFTIGLSIFSLVYVGSLLDKKMHTSWIFTVGGLIWGLAGATIYIYFFLKTER